MKRITAVLAVAIGCIGGQAGAQTASATAAAPPSSQAATATPAAAPVAGTPAAGTPAAGTPAAGMPAAGTLAAMATPPAARPADVASVDSIVAALYDVVSGPAGPRDWDRLRSLFIPGGKMAAVGARQGGGFGLRPMSVDDYIARNSKGFSETGFYESEIARTTETFGQIAHVFSTYEIRREKGDAKPFMRGINSIQLCYDGKRWYVVSLLWRAEDDKLSLPERYLKSR